jgi:hypothetical protein
MNDIYIINGNKIESANYKELVWKSVITTPTPLGIAPRFHIREEIWFKVGENLFEVASQAVEAVSDIKRDSEDDIAPIIEEVTRFEGWTWGYMGNHPKQLVVFDTQEEADKWLFKLAEIDFNNDGDAPQIFKTKAEAEESFKWIG